MSLLGQGWQDTAIVSWLSRRPGQAPTSQLIPANSSCGCAWEVSKDVRKGQEHKAWVRKFMKSFFLLPSQIPDKAETGTAFPAQQIFIANRKTTPQKKGAPGRKKSGRCISLWVRCPHFKWTGSEKQKWSMKKLLWTWEPPPFCAGDRTQPCPINNGWWGESSGLKGNIKCFNLGILAFKGHYVDSETKIVMYLHCNPTGSLVNMNCYLHSSKYYSLLTINQI